MSTIIQSKQGDNPEASEVCGKTYRNPYALKKRIAGTSLRASHEKKIEKKSWTSRSF